MSDDEPPKPVETTPIQTTWKLPDGIEEHLESGVLKTAAGALAGGLLGMALFRSGGGRRSASIAAGVGVGLGSTFQRTRKI